MRNPAHTLMFDSYLAFRAHVRDESSPSQSPTPPDNPSEHYYSDEASIWQPANPILGTLISDRVEYGKGSDVKVVDLEAFCLIRLYEKPNDFPLKEPERNHATQCMRRISTISWRKA